MTFESLGLSTSLLHAINKVGHKEPSPVQQKAIPKILERHDVLASAQTGTGKTAGFVLPVLQILSECKQPKRRPIRALVLTPTRELAAQVHENVVAYSEFLPIKSAVIFGGVNQNPQIRELRNGVDFLVATPGRLLDLHGQGKLFLNYVEVLILDEADRMLDMGFLRDIKRILPLLPPRKQNLLFSATFSKEIKLLAGTFMLDPVMVEATPENTTVEKIAQKVYYVDKSNKAPVLIKMIKEGNWQQVLVFMRTKHATNRLSKRLEKNGVSAAAIHGDKSQGARTKALAGFKAGEIRVLVATDIAARGLDIPLLPHVVNYDLPNVSEDYVHRIGRTGRAGASGEAISLVGAEEMDLLKDVEAFIMEKLPTETISGFEPTDIPEPSKARPERGQSTNEKQGKRNKGKSAQSQNQPSDQSKGRGVKNKRRTGQVRNEKSNTNKDQPRAKQWRKFRSKRK